MGSEISRPHFLALLAEALGQEGEVAEGLDVLSEAMEAAEQTGGRYYEAELYRLKGELLMALAQENRAQAEACFRQAIEMAHRQQAKSFELRAAVSLTRLLRNEEAREVLAEIYGWFTEGFDTKDLREAKELLDG